MGYTRSCLKEKIKGKKKDEKISECIKGVSKCLPVELV